MCCFQIQIGLNDEDKIQYRIEAETPNNNRLTVGWEMGTFYFISFNKMLNFGY